MRSRGRLDPPVVALCLKDKRGLQCVAQPLVLDDDAGFDVTEPVVALMAKDSAVGSDLDLAIGVLVDVDVAVDLVCCRRNTFRYFLDLLEN